VISLHRYVTEEYSIEYRYHHHRNEYQMVMAGNAMNASSSGNVENRDGKEAHVTNKRNGNAQPDALPPRLYKE
jgi:hypothetical protein